MTATAAQMIAQSMSEDEWQQQVIEAAALAGWAHYHTRDSRRSDEGFPDLVLLGNNRIVFAELKREGGKATPAQEDWIARLENAGAEVYLWRPSDLPAVLCILGLEGV